MLQAAVELVTADSAAAGATRPNSSHNTYANSSAAAAPPASGGGGGGGSYGGEGGGRVGTTYPSATQQHSSNIPVAHATPAATTNAYAVPDAPPAYEVCVAVCVCACVCVSVLCFFSFVSFTSKTVPIFAQYISNVCTLPVTQTRVLTP